MMKKLLSRIRVAVGMELTEARKNNGDHFCSVHEGYGVLAEELDEARHESLLVDAGCDLLLPSLRNGNRRVMVDYLDEIEEHATLAACEFIQTAAMARKMREGVEADKI